MVTAVTIHAMERLQERRGAVNLLKTVKKRREYPNGITEHKGWRYVVRKGVLITVLPPKKERNEKQI